MDIDKIKKWFINNKNTIISFSLIIIGILIMLLLSFYQLSITDQKYLIGNKVSEKEFNSNKLEKISQGSIIKQEFEGKYDNFQSINLKLNINKNLDYEGIETKIILQEVETNKIIFEENIDYERLVLDSNYRIDFDKQKESKNNKYELIIQLDKGTEINEKLDSALSIRYSDNNLIENSQLYINDKKTEGSIYIYDRYVSNVRALIFNITAIGLTILAIGMAIIIYTRKEFDIKKAFLYTVPILCLLYLIYMPMFRSHDEYRHWIRAYEISEGYFLTEINDGVIGSKLPVSVIDEVYTYWKNLRYKDVFDKKDVELNIEERMMPKKQSDTPAAYSSIQYLPEATGIFIARIFTDKVIIMAYCARLANLIFCVGILYLAIKIMPFGKKILFIPALIPIAIEGFSCMSPDGITISMSFLFIAYIFKLAYGNIEKIKWKNIVKLIIILVIIALCKTVYIPIVLLLFLLPKEKFKNKNKKYLNIFLIAIIAIAVNFIWLIISNKYSGLSNQLNVKEILQNPIKYLQLLIYSINLQGNNLINTMFGGQMSWSNSIQIYTFVPFSLFCMYLFNGLIDNSIKEKLKAGHILNFILIILAVIFLVFTALYTTWTPLNSTQVNGVQGRYFLPIIPLIFLIIGSLSKIKSSHKEENLLKFIAISSYVFEIHVILTIVIAHLK